MGEAFAGLLVLAFALAVTISYMAERYYSRKHRFDAVTYDVKLSCDELFEGEYFYLIQTLTNTGEVAIPMLKSEVLLPEGLQFVLPNTSSLHSLKDDCRQSVESIFTIPVGSSVTRRWRIIANKRGVYSTEDISMITVGNDLFGTSAFSVKMKTAEGVGDRVVVLPCASESIEDIALNAAYSGIRSAPRGVISDPMSVCGVRAYHPDDPMNRIDWKQTARMGRLMVREQEYQIRDSFNLLLNMQSLLIEKNFPQISAPSYIEDAIGICASLLDSAIANDSPIFMVANAPPTGKGDCLLAGDAVGEQLFCSDEYRRHDEVMLAYRMLAFLPMQISIPIEKVMDDIVSRPELYARGGHLVMVTAYLDERMLQFHRIMQERGYKVIFFVLSTGHNLMEVPPDMDVYYRPCSLGKRGTVYAV
ncbi:MAG: DUF58 domain-containing protein [Clostridia bacterium]|nr:DUF58 domain-containing protein [Clostridia bacterium]